MNFVFCSLEIKKKTRSLNLETGEPVEPEVLLAKQKVKLVLIFRLNNG